MTFPSSVLQWESIAKAELEKQGLPFPVSYVLSIIQRESNGKSGVKNPSSGASGLMQVMPVALRDYNNHHESKYTMEQLRDPAQPQIQIRVGTWILKTFFRSAYNYLKKRLSDVPLDDLVKITDTFYAAGPGAARKKLDTILPLWTNVVSSFPSWDRVKPAELIWSRSSENGTWSMPNISAWLEGEISVEKEKITTAAIFVIAILAIAWLALGKK